MKKRIICCTLFLLAVVLPPAQAQNGRWPPPGGAEPQVLRAYGTGAAVAPLREAAIAFGNQRGVLINIKSGPVQTWKTRAIRDGDIIFADSQRLMNSLIQRDLPGIIDPSTVASLSMHPSSIMVRAGNPKNIRGIKDLGRPGLKLLIVAGPDEESRWQEVARRAGGDGLMEDMLRNVEFFPASSAEAQAFWEADPSYDVWLVLRAGGQEKPKVISRQEHTIYRSCMLALTYRSPHKDLSREFIDFILSGQGQEIFSKWSGAPR